MHEATQIWDPHSSCHSIMDLILVDEKKSFKACFFHREENSGEDFVLAISQNTH